MKNNHTALVKTKTRHRVPRRRLIKRFTPKRLDREQLMRRIITQPQNGNAEMQSGRKDDYLFEIERVIVFVAVASKDRPQPSHQD